MIARFCLCAVLWSAAGAVAQERRYYFYNPENRYGSDLLFNPLSLAVNGSYDILRNGAHSKSVTQIEYGPGWRNIRRNIFHPVKHVRRYGTENFFEREFFNLNFNLHETQFAPNLLNHTIGNGMQYVKLSEWYDYHGFPLAGLWSAATVTTFQVMNEINENGSYQGTNVDPISDLLIFNPLGFLLFSFDGTKKFFTRTLPLYDWSLMPVFDPRTKFLENAGQSWVIKKPLSRESRFSGVFYWGIHGMAGLSYTPDHVHHYTVTGGIVVNKLHTRNTEQARYLTPNLDGSIGLFYDRNHSLLSSILIEGPRFYSVQATLYPGVFFSPWSPGLYISVDERKKAVFGIAFAYFPVGLAR